MPMRIRRCAATEGDPGQLVPKTDPKEGNLRGDGGGDERTRGGQPGIVDIVVGPGVSAEHDQCVRTDGGDRRRNHHRRGDPVGVGLHPDQLDPELGPPTGLTKFLSEAEGAQMLTF